MSAPSSCSSASVHAPHYLASSEVLSTAYDTLLLDLDGTTYLGKTAAPHAPHALARAKANGVITMYLTNNSGRAPSTVAAHLSQIGIPTDPDEIINSSYVAAHEAERLLPPGAKVLLIGADGLREAFAHSSLTVVNSADDAPDAVIQGLNEQATWADLSEGVLAINRWGAIHIATNLDATIPKERGSMIGNGSFVACVQHATGSNPINCGKPEPLMYRLGVERAQAQRALSVGDRLDTDIAGAVKAGYDSLHVLTGASGAREVMLASADQRPTYLGIDLRDVNKPHPAVTSHIDATSGELVWSCEGAHALVRGNVLAMREGKWSVVVNLSNEDHNTSEVTLTHTMYRAAVCAMWSAIDNHLITPHSTYLPNLTVLGDNDEATA